MKASMLLMHLGVCVLSTGLPHQYHFIRTGLPWFRAQWHCRRHFTDLATVADAKEMELLVSSVQQAASDSPALVWIGLYDNLTSWRWSQSEPGKDQESAYRNWGPDQPDNFGGDQLCVAMSSGGRWMDSPCFFKQRFVCYDDTKRADQQFVFVRKFLSWPEAQRYCRKHHTDLSSVRNEEENQEVRRLVRNRSSWIGLFRTREWSDRSESSYRNWKFGQPDNHKGQQRCTASDLMDGGLWSDENCHTKLPFICHRDGDEHATPSSLATTVRPDQHTHAVDPPSTTEELSPGHLSPGTAKDKPSAVTSTSTHANYRSVRPQSPTADQRSTVKSSTVTIQPNLLTVGPSSSPLTADVRQSTTGHLHMVDPTTLAGTRDPTLDHLGTVDQARHSGLVVRLKVKLMSRSQLSEEEIQGLVRGEMRSFLRAVGNFDSLKIIVRRS